MDQESLVQAGIMASLEVYADRNAVHTDVFAPYANQQGHAGGKYPGDIIGLLDGARILLLEVKELDYDPAGDPVLHQFDAAQYLQYYWLQQLGFPIQYAYVAQNEMPYFQFPRRREWPYATLNRTRVSPPDALIDSPASFSAKRPAVDAHDSLLDWLLNPPGMSASALALMGLLASSAADLRMSVLIVQTTHGTLMGLPAAGVRAAMKKVLLRASPDRELQRKVDVARGAIRNQIARIEEQQAELDGSIDARATALEDAEAVGLGRALTEKERRAIRKKAREEIVDAIVKDILAPVPAHTLSGSTPGYTGWRR